MFAFTFRFVGVAMIAGLVVTGAHAEGSRYTVAWQTVGAAHHTGINLDGERPPASFIVGEGNGTFGPAAVQGMHEPVNVPVSECPEGTALEFHPLAGTTVRTFRDGLDQIVYRTVSGTACIRDGVVTSENRSIVTGGTGRFEGATGELTTTTLPQTIEFPEWNGEFNNIVQVTEGEVVLAD